MARTQPADVGSLASALEVTKTGPKPRPQKGHFPDLRVKPWASHATLEVFRVGPADQRPQGIYHIHASGLLRNPEVEWVPLLQVTQTPAAGGDGLCHIIGPQWLKPFLPLTC